ncbi:hypothetical protein CARUB_v10023606mg [Capsella rubella]|uniref:DUF868 domain-containing protein n=1 Tax=Capsella rubella TaxID=81985 RepID=R0HD68_9BRAS|nr:uncharacterized protein LOC17888823 [Capsella rubella]EOA27469.1 hypothetical protein CARUB_v10023606mg [Capsella rubella]
MRDLVSCFSENSINVTHPLSLSSSSSSCSKYSTNNVCISPSSSSLIPSSTQTAITSIYKITLTKHHLIIKVTWCNPHNNNGLSISVSSADQNPSTPLKLNTSSRFFRKKKGNKSVDSDLGKIEVFWDLSSAKYDSNSCGPEPINGFYVIVLVDGQLGLLLGDTSEETLRKKGFSGDIGFDFSLVSRQEHFTGNNTFYSTKARFVEKGDSHEIVIRCNKETEGLKQSTHHHYPVLSVCIDKKTVIKVKRLQWNFRGNQTIFVDGLLVDLMWDVHDWFFSNPGGGACGRAVFMFRTRNGLDSSRLWLEEKMVKKDEQQDKLDFSLLIYACKS